MADQWFPRKPLPWWLGLLLAAAASAGAWALRGALDPVLAHDAPYTLFFLGVLVASVFGGWAAGLAATLLSGLLANASFVAPGLGPVFEGSHGWGFIVFIAVSLLLVGLVHALAASQRHERRLREELATVSDEYRHRIKNLLTVCQALVQQSGRGVRSVEEFRAKVLDRLQALARAQDLLHASEAQPLGLDRVIAETLGPFDLDDRFVEPVAGPQAQVSGDVAVSLSLLLNELATNALKHGSLTVEQGRLKLGWTAGDDLAVIRWKEVGGPAVTPPDRTGFGSRLMRDALPRQAGSVEAFFEPDGLRCEIKVKVAANRGGDGRRSVRDRSRRGEMRDEVGERAD